MTRAPLKTIGPTVPPLIFISLDFLSYLIDLKHQAFDLGWITDKGVENSLDAKLDQVKAKLQAGDTKTASNQLSAFLNEVDAQGCQNHDDCPKGKHLSPEAWGLCILMVSICWKGFDIGPRWRSASYNYDAINRFIRAISSRYLMIDRFFC